MWLHGALFVVDVSARAPGACGQLRGLGQGSPGGGGRGIAAVTTRPDGLLCDVSDPEHLTAEPL